MKKRVLLAVIGLFLAGAAVNAQSKIGYADVDYILGQMPESKQVQSELEAHNTQLQNQLQAKMQEYQQKLQAYQEGYESMIDAVRQEKETELTQLQQRIQKFQQDAQGSLQTKSNTLMEPLYKKVGAAIEAVAKENGYAYILNGQVGGIDVVLYADESSDVSDLVLKNLGVTPPSN